MRLVVAATLLLVAAPAHADRWLGGAVAVNGGIAEKIPRDYQSAISIEAEGYGYKWRDETSGYLGAVGIEYYVDTYDGTTPVIATVHLGKAHRIDKSESVWGSPTQDWHVAQFFAHPEFALAYYGVARVATDMFVEEQVADTGVGAELRNLFGLGGGGLFEIRDTNGFQFSGHLDLILYPGAEGGTAKEGELEFSAGWLGVDLKLNMRLGGVTGFSVGVGLGVRILDS